MRTVLHSSFDIRHSTFNLLVALLLLLAACTAPARRPTPTPPRMIFVGLDGADWQLLDRYCADGTMPNLAALVHQGDKRVLLTQHPPLSPLVWTTMMTGVSPLEHRILDFTRFNPVTYEREPITSDERAVPAIWNMASAQGKKVGVFGMWATDPAEPVNGTIVSDRLIRTQCAYGDDVWKRTECETEATHRIAKEWIEKNQPDLAIVYFEGTDIAGHLFAPRGGNPAYFKRIDQILGDYRNLALQLDATLIIASDHGFDWNTKRPPESSTAVATAAKWHRDEGIFLRWSPHRRLLPTLTATTMRVDQITPILIDALKLPGDINAYRRGWRKPSGATAASPRQSSEDIKKLTALGYIGSNEPSHGPAGSTRTSGSYNNEGVILREQHRDDEALAAFENALRVDPRSATAMWNLSDLLHHLNRDRTRADALLDAALEIDPSEPRWLLARGRYSLERHDCAAARTDFARAIPLQPDNALLYASLGAAEACLGHDTAARDAFRHSLSLDPNQPEIARFAR
jgi:tetratricopeptide (TPR) repeat protein